jgi:hypothetical protein
MRGWVETLAALTDRFFGKEPATKPVILSAAKDLSRGQTEILSEAKDDSL